MIILNDPSFFLEEPVKEKDDYFEHPGHLLEDHLHHVAEKADRFTSIFNAPV